MVTKPIFDIGTDFVDRIVTFVPEVSTREHFSDYNRKYFFKSFQKAKKEKLRIINDEIERLTEIKKAVELETEEIVCTVPDTLAGHGILHPCY